MIYILTMIVLFIFSRTKGNNNRYLFFLSILLLLITSCFRSPQIGIDTAGGYREYYNYVLSGGHLTWVEPAWEPINNLSIRLGLGYQGVIAISGILVILPVAYVIYKSSDNKCLSLALYYSMLFILYSYNIMRQMIAVSFALLSVYFFQNKKLCFALLCFVLGALFHKSIICVLPLCIFQKFQFNYQSTVLLIVFSFLLGVIIPRSLFFILTGNYSSNLSRAGGYEGFRNSYLIPAILAMVFSFFFLYITSFKFQRIKTNFWYLMSLFGVLVMNLTVQLGQGTRLVLYFSQAQAFLIPELLNNPKTHDNRFYLKVCIGLYLLINFLRVLFDQWKTLTPFKFFWM